MPNKDPDCPQNPGYPCSQAGPIARIEANVDTILRGQKRIFEILEGNGQPGLRTKLATLESRVEEHHAAAEKETDSYSAVKIGVIVAGVTSIIQWGPAIIKAIVKVI